MPNGPEPTQSTTPPEPGRGPLLAIGGAEDKLGKRSVLSEFVQLAGGPDARIAVIPTASSLGDEIVDVYDALFRKIGAADVWGVRPESREEAEDPEVVGRLADATGIFMTGGNQLKLSAIVNGTAFGEEIKAAHERGVVVGGTSAGASIQSSHMVAFGTGGSTPKQRMTQLAGGLGLIRDVVIDQHFGQRNRYGRLLMLVAQSPHLLGIGVDEDTGALITDDDDGHTRLRVLGRRHDLRRPRHRVQRPRGPPYRTPPRVRGGASRAPRRLGLRPHRQGAGPPGACRRPRGGRGARGCGTRPEAIGS
jgi:cyanophycinase